MTSMTADIDAGGVDARENQIEPGTPASFDAGAGRLAWLMFTTALLTVLTLGIYRFWMKTKVRHYYWGAVRIDGEPLEYTGRPLELLLGFLIAILFLAVYLFAFNFALSLFSVAYWQGFEPAVFLSALAVLPLLPYASYQSQRYLLSRTRWSGIRLGLERKAWAYTARSLAWSSLSILTLGLMWPHADFTLRKFITKNMRFGDQAFELTGKSSGLYRAFLPMWGLFALTVGCFIGAYVMAGPFAPMTSNLFWFAAAFYVAALIALIGYSAFRTKYILNRTVLGEDGVRLASTLSTSSVVGVVLTGYLMMILVAIVAVIAVTALVVVAALVFHGTVGDLAQYLPEPGVEPSPAQTLPIAIAVIVLYLVIGLALVVAGQVFVTRRVLRRIVDSTSVIHLDRVAAARQRPHDEDRGAEGFADALDVGAF